MIRDGQRRAEWVEKILPYAREHGAEVSNYSFSFFNQRSETNIISLKHDSEHKISSLSSKYHHYHQTFGAVGTCWGGYMVLRLSSYGEFKAGEKFESF